MISILTPTGDRLLAFALCEGWMLAQDYDGDVQWVIVDDGVTETPVSFERKGWTIDRLRLQPQPGTNTQARNMLAGLEHCRGDAVLVIEDDDFYSPGYVAKQVERLAQSELVGEMHARYYNLANRTYHVHRNERHASLCQTAVRDTARLALEAACKTPGKQFIDLALWRNYPGQLFDTALAVGIKGLPGRGGIGKGHHMEATRDPRGDKLREWVGKDAADLYLDIRMPLR